MLRRANRNSGRCCLAQAIDPRKVQATTKSRTPAKASKVMMSPRFELPPANGQIGRPGRVRPFKPPRSPHSRHPGSVPPVDQRRLQAELADQEIEKYASSTIASDWVAAISCTAYSADTFIRPLQVLPLFQEARCLSPTETV